jgi:quinohemoprotein ethanol dehydrogenase
MGEAVYSLQGCDTCHGEHAVNGAHTSAPDLRKASATTYGSFEGIVRGGARKDRGMPMFLEGVSHDDVEAIKAYVLDRAWNAYDAQQAKTHN